MSQFTEQKHFIRTSIQLNSSGKQASFPWSYASPGFWAAQLVVSWGRGLPAPTASTKLARQSAWRLRTLGLVMLQSGQATRHSTVTWWRASSEISRSWLEPWPTFKYPTTWAPALFTDNLKLLEHQGSLRNQNAFHLAALLHTYGANESRFFLFLYSPSAVPYYCTLVLFVPLYELVCSSFGKNTIFLPVFEQLLA